MSVPVIATRACNMPEITEYGTGWEIETNADALTAALSELLGRPAEENWAKGRNGARLIAERYSPARVAQQMAEVYAYVQGGPEPQHTLLLTEGSR
jgi:glycosyltransferase involved in cell wall biosynthesis